MKPKYRLYGVKGLCFQGLHMQGIRFCHYHVWQSCIKLHLLGIVQENVFAKCYIFKQFIENCWLLQVAFTFCCLVWLCVRHWEFSCKMCCVQIKRNDLSSYFKWSLWLVLTVILAYCSYFTLLKWIFISTFTILEVEGLSACEDSLILLMPK